MSVVRELGVAELLSAQPRAIGHLNEALAMTGEPRERGVISQHLANALVLPDLGQDAVAVPEAALQDLGDIDRALAQALEAQLLGAAAARLSTRPVQRDYLARVRVQKLGDSPTERMLLAHLALWTCCEGERASIVRALAERAVAGGRLLAEVGSEAQTFSCVVHSLMTCDALEEARY